jgi:hypothetical protein
VENGDLKLPNRSPGNELAVASLALLRELEASLETSQKALLARDLESIEQETREQMRLQQSLAILLENGLVSEKCNGMPQTILRRVCNPDTEQLLLTAQRVLHLGWVQATLLNRAQQSLQMISRLLAGPSATYVPPSCALRGHRTGCQNQ